MANVSVTYTFVNGATSDAPSVNQNFTDIVNGLSDGTKAISVDSVAATSISASSARLSSLTGPTLSNVTFDASTNTLSNVSNTNISTTAAIAVSKIATGTAGQVLGTNPGGTANEFKSVVAGSSGSDFTVTMTTGTFTINLPDAGASSRGLLNASTVTQSIGGPKQFASSVAYQTTGGTSTKFDYYEEGTFTANFNANAGAGAGAANTSKTMKFTRIGNQVTLQYPDCSNMTAGTTDSSFKAATALPSRLRPSTELDWVSIQMSSNGVSSTSPGNLSLRTNGDMYIFRNANASTNFGIGDVNNGCGPTTVTYTIA